MVDIQKTKAALEDLKHDLMRREGAQQILAINAALERLQDGTYGLCTKCHTAIGDERLAAVPYTPFCADCAKSVR